MNDTRTEDGPLPVSEVASYAHRTPDGVRLVLHLTGPTLVGATTLRLRRRVAAGRGDKIVRTAVTVRSVEDGVVVEATAPQGSLGPGVWNLAVGDGGPFQRLQAVLLIGKGRPIALLPGPRPRTRMPEPQPRPARTMSERTPEQLNAEQSNAVRSNAVRSNAVRSNPVRRMLGRVRRAVQRRS